MMFQHACKLRDIIKLLFQIYSFERRFQEGPFSVDNEFLSRLVWMVDLAPEKKVAFSNFCGVLRSRRDLN